MSKEANVNEAIRVGEEWVRHHRRNGSWTMTESEWDETTREIRKLVVDVALRVIAPERPESDLAAKLVEARGEIARLRAVELAADAVKEVLVDIASGAGVFAAQRAAAAVAAYRLAKKETEDRWAILFGPFEKHLRELRTKMREAVTMPLEAAEVALKAQVIAYEAEEQERVRRESEERRKAEEERRRKEDLLRQAGISAAKVREYVPPQATPAPVLHVGPTRAASGAGVTVIQEPYVEVVDLAAVPLEFIAVNERAILTAWKNGQKEIPGVVVKMRAKARGL